MNNNISVDKITFISVILILMSISGAYYFYDGDRETTLNDIKKEARELKDYVILVREFCQNKFLEDSSKVNKKSLSSLSSCIDSEISETFTLNNKNGYYAKSISSHPRNSKQMADKEELRALAYFNDDAEKSEYIHQYTYDGKKFYQYAAPLHVKTRCLICHGDKKQTLEIIQKKYSIGFGYKVGDLIGIISIKIPATFY